MRVVGVTTPVGGPVVDFHVDHGAHPAVTLFDLGYVQLRPLSAELIGTEIVYKALVREVVPADNRPQDRFRIHVDPQEDALVPVQRQAAYALILSERGLLGTVNSAQSHAAGVWALPGGGINPGESPSDGLLREIHEETGKRSSSIAYWRSNLSTGWGVHSAAGSRTSMRFASSTVAAANALPIPSSMTSGAPPRLLSGCRCAPGGNTIGRIAPAPS